MHGSTEGLGAAERRAFFARLMPARTHPEFPGASIDQADLGFDLVPAWRRDDPRIARDALTLWSRTGALPAGTDPAARVDQLAAAAYREGELIGVATAQLAELPRFRRRFALYRHLVAPEHRGRLASSALLCYVRDIVEHWSAAHPDEDVVGLAAVIETPNIGSGKTRPIWSNSGLNLVGYTPDRRQIRAYWFAHARLH